MKTPEANRGAAGEAGGVRGEGGGEVHTPHTTNRARARSVDEVVSEIARHMVGGTWGGATVLAIAEREGVKPGTVREWSSDAGRLLRIGPDVEAYRGINLRRLDETYASAEDAKARVAAVAEQNRMLGLHAPTTHKVDVSATSLAALDDNAMLERLDAQIARLTELRSQLLQRMALPALPANTEDDDGGDVGRDRGGSAGDQDGLRGEGRTFESLVREVEEP